MIKGIIFDFDGILVHSENANIQAAIKTFDDIGLPLTDEERNSIPGRSSIDFIAEFLRARGDDSVTSHEEVFMCNKENYKSIWHTAVAMFPHVKNTLEVLHTQNIVMGIATTNRLETIEMYFQNFGTRDYFSFIVTGEDVQKRKPDPEVYSLAIEKSGLTSEELIAVEDTHVGLTSAKRAGLRCAVIPNEYTLDHDFREADYILDSIGELLKIKISVD